MRRRLTLVVLSAVVLAACSERPSPTSVLLPSQPPAGVISDGANGNGNPNFFFLPPLVTNPSQSTNWRAGSSNAHLQPVVRVFLVPPGAVGCSISGTPAYGPTPLRLDGSSEQYQVNWDTKASSLQAGGVYRLCVYGSPTPPDKGGVMLGFVDVEPVTGGMKKLVTGDVYAFQDDRTLPIKVRIQNGALSTGCTDPASCSEAVVIGAAPGSPGDTAKTILIPSDYAALALPPGAVGSKDTVTIVIQKEAPPSNGKCLPTDIAQADGCWHFSSEPAGYAFVNPVRIEACVDLGPVLAKGYPEDAFRLFKYNTTEGLKELPWADPQLINCNSFVAAVSPTRAVPSSFAAATLDRIARWLGRLVSPPPLYAYRFKLPPRGGGGTGGGFSDVGGAVPGTATQAALHLTVPPSATVGQAGLAAMASGGSGTGVVTITSLTTPVCTAAATGDTSAAITTLAGGTCSLQATKAADNIYKKATSDTGSFSVLLADLLVSSVNLETANVVPGGQISFNYVVRNAGAEGPPSVSTFDVAVYLSSDTVWDANDVEVGGAYSVWQYHLNSGWARYDTVTNVAIPANIALGTYHLIVVADAKPGQPPNYYPGVTESNESNNWRASITSVTVTVPAPVIVLEPDSAHFAAIGIVDPTPDTVAVTNGGGGTLSGLGIGTISYGPGASGWLTASINPTIAPATVTLTATLGSLNPGTYTATVPVTSTASGVTNSPQNISVSFTVWPIPAVATDSLLPPAAVGQFYSMQLLGSGGDGYYHWLFSGVGSLPPGMSISESGLLSGTPTTAGNYAFLVSMQSAGFGVQKWLRLSVQ